MHFRTLVALGVATVLLIVGVLCHYFNVPYAKLIAVPIFAVSGLLRIVLIIAGLDFGEFFPKLVGHLAGTALTLWFYTVLLRRFMRMLGLFKTEEERVEDAAQGGFLGKLVGYAVGIGFVVLILKLQGQQSDDFTVDSRAAAEAHCAGDAACLANLDAHFTECFDSFHDSHRSGKYNRKHTLDREGFDQCLASYQVAAQEPAAPEEGLPTLESTEGGPLPGEAPVAAESPGL